MCFYIYVHTPHRRSFENKNLKAFNSDLPTPLNQGGWPKENFWEFDTVDVLGITYFTTVWEAPEDLYKFLHIQNRQYRDKAVYVCGCMYLCM
jgi:hypothetical protein